MFRNASPLLFLLVLFLTAGPVFAEENTHSKKPEFNQPSVQTSVIQKIEVMESMAHVWVESGFYRLDYNAKSLLISQIWSYLHSRNGNHSLIILKDSQTDREIGIYGKSYGGLQLY